MKLATRRRRSDALSGVSGVARLDRRTTRLAGRLNPGDIAVIDHVDLDRVTAELLVAARPAAIPSRRSGRSRTSSRPAPRSPGRSPARGGRRP